MQVVRTESQNEFAVWCVAKLTADEVAAGFLQPSQTPGFWGGEVLEVRNGLRSEDTYARVKLYKD